jgi:hypothetical protein
VRVIQADGQKQLWVGTFDRDLRDLPAAEDEVAAKIAVATHVSLTLIRRQVHPVAGAWAHSATSFSPAHCKSPKRDQAA